MQHVVGVSAKDGALLWKQDFPGRTAVIPTPIVKDNLVYVTAGYNAGCMLLKIEPENKVSVVYRNQVITNHHGGVEIVAVLVNRSPLSRPAVIRSVRIVALPSSRRRVMRFLS